MYKNSTKLLIGGLAIVLLLVAAEVVTLGLAVRDLQHGANLLVASGQAIAGGAGVDATTVAEAARERDQAAPILVRGRNRIVFDPILRLLARLPMLGPNVRATFDLSDALVAAADAESELLQVAALYTAPSSPATNPGQRMNELLIAAEPSLARADARLRPATSALANDERRPLLGPVASQVHLGAARLTKIQGLVEQLDAASRVLPGALGAAGPRKYLLILANPAELRPAGGLAGTVGTVTITNGQPTNLHVESYLDLNPKLRRCFSIPGPLKTYFRFYRNCLEIGDATWDPDFPTSARLAEDMYQSATGETVDGSISLDPYTIAAVLGVTGPVEVKPYGSFDAANVFDRLNVIVNVDGDRGSIGVLSQVLIAKIMALPPADLPKFASAMAAQASGRHIQVAFHQPPLARVAADAHYDGSIRPTPANEDYLMVVDANMHQSKADHFMTKSAELRVEAYPSGLDRHELKLRYDYPQVANPNAADKIFNLDGNYVDYMRVYVPETAVVSSISYTVDGKPTGVGADQPSTESGKRVIAVAFTVPRGHVGELRIFYTAALAPNSPYHLYLQKQAGIEDRATEVKVSFPGGLADRQSRLNHDEDYLIQW